MVDSILNTIKPMVGIEITDTNFDAVLIPFINSALNIINQLGVGPSGFRISDDTKTWTDLLGVRDDLDLVLTNVYLRVRLWFDPPTNSFLVASINEQIKETDFRIESWHKPQTIIESIIIDE